MSARLVVDQSVRRLRLVCGAADDHTVLDQVGWAVVGTDVIRLWLVWLRSGVPDSDDRCQSYADLGQLAAEGLRYLRASAAARAVWYSLGGSAMPESRDGAPESGLAAVFPPRQGRAAAMPRLLELDGCAELTATHVRLVAQALGKSERTVWRWLAAAREDQRLARVESSHFTVTTEVRRLLALWGGNASRVHAELVQRAADDPDAPAVPSLSTLHRAIRRDLTRGERAGLKSGEAARRAHDVFGQRPPTHRNAAWEGDHKHVPVEVDVEGELATPWVTWFIDCATKAITGVAVTAHAPSRDAVLASLRIAITRSEPFGPVGGLPGQIRVDRGKEFLCATVTAAMGALAVPVTDLPAYTPHLKGTIEALNDAVEEM
jgi:putative transposase